MKTTSTKEYIKRIETLVINEFSYIFIEDKSKIMEQIEMMLEKEEINSMDEMIDTLRNILKNKVMFKLSIYKQQTINSFIKNVLRYPTDVKIALTNLKKFIQFIGEYNIKLSQRDIKNILEMNISIRETLKQLEKNDIVINNSIFKEFSEIAKKLPKKSIHTECESVVTGDIINDVFSKIDTYILSKDEEQILFKKLTDNITDNERRQIIDYICKCNTRLVIKIAKKYRNDNMPLEDIIQEGNIGLLNAIDTFDYTLGYKFSTYAADKIKQVINRSIENQAEIIRKPAPVVSAKNQINKFIREFKTEHGVNPTVEDIVLRFPKLKKTQIINNLNTAFGCGSLNEKCRIDEDSKSRELIDTIPDITDIETDCINEHYLEQFKHILATEKILSDEEFEIIKMKFGIGFDREMTFKEISDIKGYSRQRASQIVNNSLKKLRRNSKVRKLKI